MIKHKYEPSRITPGRCGASELVPGTQGHFICCGKPESHETHNQAHCPVCLHHFTPEDEPLCPRCKVYVPEAFEVIVRRTKEPLNSEIARLNEHIKDLNHDVQASIDEANWQHQQGDEYGSY